MAPLEDLLAARPIDASPDLSPAEQEPWPAVRLLIVVVLVMATLLAGVLVYDTIGRPDPVTTTPVSDPFEVDGPLDEAPDGRTWTTTGGQWTVADGVASPSSEPVAHTAVLDAGVPGGEVAATVARIGPGMRLFFRWQDEQNHWSLQRGDRLATWMLVRTRDGRPERVGITGLSGTSVGTRVSVLLVDDEIHVLLAGVERLVHSDPFLADAHIGGMGATGGAPPVGAFDDIVVRPPFVPSS